MSMQPLPIHKPRGNDIVTSTVTKTVRLQTQDRTGRDSKVAPSFCERNALTGGNMKWRAESQKRRPEKGRLYKRTDEEKG